MNNKPEAGVNAAGADNSGVDSQASNELQGVKGLRAERERALADGDTERVASLDQQIGDAEKAEQKSSKSSDSKASKSQK